jgi:hypothetical protein
MICQSLTSEATDADARQRWEEVYVLEVVAMCNASNPEKEMELLQAMTNSMNYRRAWEAPLCVGLS